MKITDSKPANPIERTPPEAAQAQQTRQGARPDRISVAQTRTVAEMAQSAKQAVNEDRDVRLKRLEAAVKEGSYRPSAAKVAEEILVQAELDAKLRTLLTG